MKNGGDIGRGRRRKTDFQKRKSPFSLGPRREGIFRRGKREGEEKVNKITD